MTGTVARAGQGAGAGGAKAAPSVARAGLKAVVQYFPCLGVGEGNPRKPLQLPKIWRRLQVKKMFPPH